MSKNKQGLYHPEFERDNCGFGLIAHMDGAQSHWLVSTAIEALNRMTHRGAVAADGKSGDGCGLLMKMPASFMRAVAAEQGMALGERFGVGTVFLAQELQQAAAARTTLEQELRAEGLSVAGWRVVPTDSSACGESAKVTQPQIDQVFVNCPVGMDSVDFERHLYIARRRSEKACLTAGDRAFYIPTLSAKVISYKGMVMPEYLPVFFPDLGDARLESTICVFHQRFATNTMPEWRLAQPFRYLAHNGEINTIRGNRNWARARSYTFATDKIPNMDDIRPWVSMEGSDSSSLDNMLEALMAGGVDIFRAMRLLIPPAWQNAAGMDPDLRAFYEYNSMHMEPWDGPAGIVLTDGRYAACTLDRNGLRPARYVITKPGISSTTEVEVNDYSGCVITLASEVGVYDYVAGDVLKKGRLKPGQMLAVDTDSGQLILPEDVDNHLKSAQPYRQWMSDRCRRLSATIDSDPLLGSALEASQLAVYQKLFQLTFEERDQILRVLAEAGMEATASMGDDAPFPVMSKLVRSVYDNFRQQFAQVTNPPIDPIREEIVMSLETLFGREQNLFAESAQHASRVIAHSPILSESGFQELMGLDGADFAHEVIDLNYALDFGLSSALEDIAYRAVEAVRNGAVILVLSDRNISKDKLCVHASMAVGAVHHRLMAEGERCNANIVVETATARDPHHFAVLLGYGATAIFPYLAYEAINDMVNSGEIIEQDRNKLGANFRKGINKGLYKVMSKMGISSVSSYRGSQLFEIVGLSDEVVDRCFLGTTSRVQGAGFSDLELDCQLLVKNAWNPRKSISQGGLLKFIHGGEYHAYNPDVITTIHKAVDSGDYDDYLKFAKLVNERPPTVLRDLLRLREGTTPISIDEVESPEALFKRFDTAAMSMGALSPEAHEALAIAMNELGGRSNSGEGGENPARFNTNKVSKIKQIASGRFGVTPEYLVNAEVLQIKVAQGAKPGEGGQLPGHKVNEMVAKQRYTRPGVTLISPPPHHDIYSIEDLAQLIFDLKQVNPEALVSVKLVAEPGVGTIAAGVAKAYADLITISGYDGGTAASPIASVKYAGSPWELGLSETHQVLRMNGLRGKVRVQTDGGLKTGLDVIKAAILGAESFAFGTMPMVVLGCKFLRICHLNNCATGVATQNEVLRSKHYKGSPELVKNYFHFIAREVREWMAKLGIRTMEELVGRTDLLEMLPGETPKQQKLDLMPLLSQDGQMRDEPHYCIAPRNEPFDKGVLAEEMVVATLDAITHKLGGEFNFVLKNVNRSIGARLSGEIAKRHGNQGMATNPITIKLTGTAGQSFGVWNAGGLHLELEGDANDYVGKGMTGGEIVIWPPANSRFASNENTIIGNTCLYGATGGTLLAAGMAGERFGVRNSGSHAVVEGVGDHCCEYMTGGVITVLGSTGINFGAGMTGGFAYVLDIEGAFQDRYNHDVDIYRIDTGSMLSHRNYLRECIEHFVAKTGSTHGQQILDNFGSTIGQFWLVKPRAENLETLFETVLKEMSEG